MTKKLPDEIKKSRKPISRACKFCHTKHLQCDPGRPCQNCIKRGIQDTCESVERKKSVKWTVVKPENDKARLRRRTPKILKKGTPNSITKDTHNISFVNYTGNPTIKLEKSPGVATGYINVKSSSAESEVRQPEQHMFYNQSPAHSIDSNALSNHSNTPVGAPLLLLLLPVISDLTTPVSTTAINQEPVAAPPMALTASSSSIFQDHSDSSSSEEPEIKARPNLISYHADSLNDIINKDDLNFMLNAYNQSIQESKAKFQSALVDDEYLQLTNLLTTNPPSPSDFFDFEINERAYIQLGETDPADSRNRDKNFIHINTSAILNSPDALPSYIQEEQDYTAPLIFRHVIKTPDDIYLTNVVKSYQYPKLYHALIHYLKQRFNREQLLSIAKCMAAYRPSFISATKSLYENDLIFTEKSFQRSLLEYENLISMSATPTIIWRRTGEITALTNEFSALTGYTRANLLSKRTFIVELMDDPSALRYFKLFSDIAFGDLNATILTDCVIKKADSAQGVLKCASVWTIKRDVFDIPMLIVGQFLPII